MARIPIYNQGRGTTQQLATGSLSPAANTGAFAAPGQALASFADSAQQIAFNFGMAERDREDKAIIAEEESKFLDLAGSNELQTKDTTVGDASERIDKIINKFKGRFDKDYDSRRSNLLKQKLSSTFDSFKLKAKQNAFNRGNIIAGTKIDSNIDKGLSDLRSINSKDPEYEIKRKKIIDTINEAKVSGIPISYTSSQIRTFLKNKTSEDAVSNIQNKITNSTSITDLNLIQKEITSKSGKQFSTSKGNVLSSLLTQQKTIITNNNISALANHVDFDLDREPNTNSSIINDKFSEVKDGTFGGDEDKQKVWKTLSESEKSKVIALAQQQATQVQSEIRFRQFEKNNQIRENNETIFNDNLPAALDGTLTFDKIKKLEFQGSGGATLRNNLQTILMKNVDGNFADETAPIVYRRIFEKIVSREVRSINDKFLIEGERQAKSILERDDIDNATFRTLVSDINSFQKPDTAGDFKLFGQFLDGNKDLILGSKIYRQFDNGGEARFFDFSIQMRKRFERGLAEGKSAISLLDRRSNDYILKDENFYRITSKEILKNYQNSLRIDNQNDLTLDQVRPPTREEVARLIGVTNIDLFTQQDYLNSGPYQLWFTSGKYPVWLRLRTQR